MRFCLQHGCSGVEQQTYSAPFERSQKRITVDCSAFLHGCAADLGKLYSVSCTGGSGTRYFWSGVPSSVRASSWATSDPRQSLFTFIDQLFMQETTRSPREKA